MYDVCMVIIYSKGKDQPGKAANPRRGQLNRENDFSLSPSALDWSRETSSAATSIYYLFKPPYAIGSVPSF